MTPREIFTILSTDVIGQEKALQDMSVVIYKHPLSIPWVTCS
jgi:ATP-dependent protease Clp ATPase subunit